MVVACFVVGVVVGSLLNWAGDYLARFASVRPARSSPRLTLAVWHLVTSRAASRRLGPLGLNIAVELGAGLLLVLLWERLGFSCKYLYTTAACLFFLLIAIVDLKHQLVLNVLVYPVAAITLLVHSVPPGRETLVTLLGGTLGLAPFLAAALLKPEGIGAGDVKLAALIGLMVGFPEVMAALIVAVMAGGGTALVLLLTRRWKLESHIPYAPFLCLGAVFSLVYAPSSLLFPR
jgi:prepilin signal peptidase PulO-like enzyme (type II secretory pathway)